MSIAALVVAVVALVIAVSTAKCVTNMGVAMVRLEKMVTERQASKGACPSKPAKPAK